MIQAYVFPLVSWIWIGVLVLVCRHLDLPGSEQGAAAVCAHGSGGLSRRNMHKWKSSLADRCSGGGGAWRRRAAADLEVDAD